MADKSKNLLKLSVLCLLVMLATLAFLLFYPLLVPGNHTLDEQIFLDNAKKPLDGFLLDGNAQSIYPFTDDTILRISPDSVEYLNMQGQSNKIVEVSLTKPMLVSNQNFSLVYDLEGQNYYLFDRYGLVYKANAKAPIQAVRLAKDGHVALIMQTDNSKGSLRVMNPNGKHLFDYDIKDRENSGYLLSAAFSNDSAYLDLSLLNTDSVKLYPLVTRFNLKTLKVVVNYQIDYNGALPLILRSSANNMILLSESDVFHIVNQQFVRWFAIAELKEAQEVLRGIAILASKTFQANLKLYYVDVTDNEPSESNSVELGNSPESLICNNSYAAVIDGQQVYRVNVATMRSEKFRLSSPIVRIALDSQNRLIIVTENKVIRV